MQDAFIAESGVYAGSWSKIGYAMANSNSFSYTPGSTLEGGTTTLEGLTKTEGWKATNNAKLNDCPKGMAWTLSLQENTANAASSGSPVLYTAESENKTVCGDALTPNFEKLTTASATGS